MRVVKIAGVGLPLMLAMSAAFSSPAAAQSAVETPIIADPAKPIVVQTQKPKSKQNGLAKFEGFVMHANIAQITARAKGNDLAILTFPLSQAASMKMQQVIDKGGYQYGDKVTIFYDPVTMRAAKVKGKPSKPI